MAKKYDQFEVNGAKVGVYPMHEVEAVEVNLDFKAGSRYETGNKWGAMHLLEHMVHEGTKSFPLRQDVENYKERHGIASNAYTSGNSIRFWFRAPGKSVKAVFKLAEEIVFNPTIPSDILPREKNVIAQEYRDKWSNPRRRFDRASDEFLFGKNHPYIRDGMGQPEYVNTFTSKKLKAIHKKFIVPGNLYIGVAGKVKTNDVKKLVGSLLEGRGKGKQFEQVQKPVKPKAAHFYHKEDVEQTVVYIDWFAPGYDDLSLKEETTFRLAKYILGGSSLSLLFNELRLNMGIAYSGGAAFGSYPKKSYFETYTSTDYKNIAPAIEAMKRIVNDFLKNGVPSSRFYQAKKFLDMQLLLRYDSVGGIANGLAYDLFYYDRIIALSEHRKNLASITQKDMQKLLYYYLTKKSYISIMSRKAPPKTVYSS